MLMSRKGGMTFVSRNNPAAADWTKATLNTDGNWHTLDLTSIIPATAKVVLFNVYASSNAAGNGIRLRPVGASNGFNDCELNVMVSGQKHNHNVLVVPVAGSIDYAITTSAGLSLNLTIVGWFL